MDQQLFKDFHWRNESKMRFENDALVLYAPPNSDYFYSRYVDTDPAKVSGVSYNAPFFHTKVTGDFVMRVQVSHDFLTTYDAASIMVMQDLKVWAKACFEKTDFDTHAVVSVVTDHISDDANGCNIQGNSVWLQAARVDTHFAFHYSLDGEQFDMMRYFSLPAGADVMVGLVPQSPAGKGGDRVYRNFSLHPITLQNLRAGK